MMEIEFIIPFRLEMRRTSPPSGVQKIIIGIDDPRLGRFADGTAIGGCGALRQAVTALGCEVTSNMTSLVVLNLPGALKGREKELVQMCRAEGFGIWPTLSEPVQVRIGILNQITPAAITDIVNRFGKAMNDMGANVDMEAINALLDKHYTAALEPAE
mgnify:CR=1 FL=1